MGCVVVAGMIVALQAPSQAQRRCRREAEARHDGRHLLAGGRRRAARAGGRSIGALAGAVGPAVGAGRPEPAVGASAR